MIEIVLWGVILLSPFIGIFCGFDLVTGETGLLYWLFAVGGEIVALCFIGKFFDDMCIDSDSIATKVLSIIGTVFWAIGLTLLIGFSDPESGVLKLKWLCLAGIFIAPYLIMASLYACFDTFGVVLTGILKVLGSILFYLGKISGRYRGESFEQRLAFFIIVSFLALLSLIMTFVKPAVCANNERKKQKEKERLEKERLEEEQRKISCSQQLLAAVQNNDKDAVLNMLEQGADVNYKDLYGQTPLRKAVKNNNRDMVLFLIEKGADVNCKSSKPVALNFAIENESEDMILLLLEKGANVNFRFKGEVLLFFAMEKNYKNLVSFLIEKGVHKKARFNGYDDLKEMTPLYFAVFQGNKDMVLLLLKNGANANFGAKCNDAKVAPLFWATKESDKEMVSILIENGADVNLGDVYTPLSAATKNNDKDMILFLLEKGAYINYETSFTYQTPLMQAVRENNTEMISFLLENGADINFKNSMGHSPLMTAISLNNKDMASFLIEKGADVNSTDKNEISLLQQVIVDKNEKMLSLLLAAGADVNRNSSKRETALQDAVDFRAYSPEIASLLIEKGADVNLESAYDGHTPLTLAVSQNNKDAVSLLLEKKADPNKKSSKFGAPLTVAFEAVNKEMISLLMKNDADPCEIFLIAAAMPKPDVSQFLLDNGADVNCESSDGLTPLFSAISFGSKEMALFLISNGADVNFERTSPSKKKSARTPLEFAIVTGNAEMVSLLLTYGADVNYKTKNGNTPLMFAAIHGKSDLVPILKEAGAVANAVTNNAQTVSSISADHANFDLSENSEDFTTVLVALSKIIAKNGAEIFASENSQKLKALVSDLIPSENEFAEKLKDALSCNFSQIIFDAANYGDGKKEEALKKSINKIVSETSVEKEYAVLIVKLTALSLDWSLENFNLND